jgi:HAD superfamily hydrolase (TIGR01549 family)
MENYLPGVKAFPKVRELFERILGEGKRAVLASSAHEDELSACKERARIADLVENETSQKDARKSKPHPDIFQAALDKLDGVAPSEAIVVGDTPWDAIAARRADLRTIGVLCGGVPAEKLRESGCVAVYQGPADLLARYRDSLLA